jgi:hypothetical protein
VVLRTSFELPSCIYDVHQVYLEIMTIEKSIEKAYQTAASRKWDTIYVLVDVHDTLAESNYKDTNVVFYPQAMKALRELSQFSEVHLVLWTCCHQRDWPKYLARFVAEGVHFRGVNTTPVQNTETGCFDLKPYFSVLIDDKAGFDPKDWPNVAKTFREARRILGV